MRIAFSIKREQDIRKHQSGYRLGVVSMGEAYNNLQCKKVTLEISKNIFKDPQHPAIILATKGADAAYFACLTSSAELQKGWHIEWINNLDQDSLSYFG